MRGGCAAAGGIPLPSGCAQFSLSAGYARLYTARISQRMLQVVHMLPWPVYSPDISLIEHIWDVIGRHLQILPLPHSEELWQIADWEWKAIPQNFIRTLTESLPRHCCFVYRRPQWSLPTSYWAEAVRALHYKYHFKIKITYFLLMCLSVCEVSSHPSHSFSVLHFQCHLVCLKFKFI